jgi:pyridoxal phosphate enzyme (YggS family)|tara:strand:+ start:182 stop:841 length:660 start_codon:yes stop_codon:yes gene_type:complete
MSSETINKLNSIQDNIDKLLNPSQKKPKIICVSKTFSIDRLLPLINYGHIHFGENKVQEAISKWTDIKQKNKGLQLHMVGKLQSNKVKKALGIFDYIHSLDNHKLADVLKKNEIDQNKKLSYFIQVNIGDEKQKSGILPQDLKDFTKYCINENSLNVVGLMAIPPNDDKAKIYFEKLSIMNSDLGFSELSMGMSSDYLEATKFKSSFLRIGSAILGARK